MGKRRRRTGTIKNIPLVDLTGKRHNRRAEATKAGPRRRATGRQAFPYCTYAGKPCGRRVLADAFGRPTDKCRNCQDTAGKRALVKMGRISA